MRRLKRGWLVDNTAIFQIMSKEAQFDQGCAVTVKISIPGHGLGWPKRWEVFRPSELAGGASAGGISRPRPAPSRSAGA